MRKVSVIISVLITIMSGVLLGIIVHNYDYEKVAQAQENEINKIAKIQERNIVITASIQTAKTTPNCTFQFEIKYEKCGHSEIINKKIEEEDINKTEEQISKKYSDWVIKSFSPTSVKFVKSQNQICENHFVIKEDEGIIKVYRLNKDENQVYVKDTDIIVKYLPEQDQELLKEGIEIHGELELSNKLSDYE